MSSQAFCLFIFALLLLPIFTSSHWWFMSQLYMYSTQFMCDVANLPGHQQQLCQQNPDVVVSVGKGAQLAVQECQNQMENEMWNCSTDSKDASVFGKVTRKATRESAFVYAISSAGVVHEVTRACRRGELRHCYECDTSPGFVNNNDSYQWNGCGDHLAYGTKFAKLFVDSLEKGRDARAKINLHNNRLGRRAVKNQTVHFCVCHGPSASCVYITCYENLAHFSKVGSYLLEKYRNVAKVTVHQKDNELILSNVKLALKPSCDDLVFSEKSPDYCEPNSVTGSMGTSGRFCSRAISRPGSCKILCCGRGYNTVQVRLEYKCRCKAQWCCRIQCDWCREVVNKYVCR
ncbi:protein Wnt-2-like [Montipora capricornis]|uniref:protein Wnt-2-like n=1 Tax=Montipora capricornis TaxID=246305 RepID=UPI0035F112F2